MLVAFDYDAHLIDTLKQAIPGRCRRWDPEQKVWAIGVRWWDTALRVFEMYGLVEGVQSPASAWDALHLKPTAPPEVVDVVYRTLAKLHHPDRGGSSAIMTRLNLAYEQVRGDQ
jgi:hypothetical protein